MFRFLVVEDDKNTLEEILSRLNKIFPGCSIEFTESARPAVELVVKSSETNRPFDVAILDFKLPWDLGDNPEINTKICDKIRELTSYTFVIHITSYNDDPHALRHLLECHRPPSAPWGDFVFKTSTKWPEELEKKIAAYLYGLPIIKRLNMLSDWVGTGGISFTYSPRVVSRGSTTHELAMLFRNIEERWDFLEKTLQERIKQYFCVDENNKPVRVSLLQNARRDQSTKGADHDDKK